MKISKIVYAACCSFLALSLIGCNPETPESGNEENQTEAPSTPTTPEKPTETPEQTPTEEEKPAEQETPKEEETPSETEKEPEKTEEQKDPENTQEETPDTSLPWEKIDYLNSKSSYGTTYSITVTDESDNPLTEAYKVSTDGKIITLIGNNSGEQVQPAIYIISGFFNGQIINEAKNNEIVLNDAYIINENAPAIIAKKKTQISTKDKTKNYIVSTGTDKTYEKSAAIYCEGLDNEDKLERKSIEFGGKGTCYIVGSIYHAVRANNVELKGNGTYYFQGSAEGAGINCKTLSVKEDKNITAYFVNSKNGIKANEFVEINSGTYYFGNLKTAIKTDIAADDINDGKTPKDHFVRLYGNTFNYNSKNVEKWVSTDDKKYIINDTTVINKL